MRYQRPPIVAQDGIQNAKDLCPYIMGGCKILVINPLTTLKVGYTVHMGEAESLYLKSKKSIPSKWTQLSKARGLLIWKSPAIS